MDRNKLEIAGDNVRICDLDIPRKDVANYFLNIPENEHELAMIQAVEVGVFCLERTKAGQETEFMRRQIELLIAKVETKINAIPGTVQKDLINKIGTNEGQVLAPIQTLINNVSDITKEKIKEIKDLLSNDLDPSKTTSILGKALNSLKELLDPERKDSIQGSFEKALENVTAKDGVLTTTVKNVVSETIKQLTDEVKELSKEVRGKEAAEEVLQQSTGKGAPYEEEIVIELQKWASISGAEIQHVGNDNSPGDILVQFQPTSINSSKVTIIIEVKDRESNWGRKRITTALSEAMAERNANAAIFLTKTQDGLAKEIGDWAEGVTERGNFVATVHHNLTVAIRLLIAQQKLHDLHTIKSDIDPAIVENQLERIRTSLKRITNINTKVTGIRDSIASIEDEAESLKKEIRSALTEIEDSISSNSTSSSS